MPAPVNRISVSVSDIDLIMIEELSSLTGQSLSAAASRAVSEWLVEHFEERKRFYSSAIVMPIPSRSDGRTIS